MDSYSLANARLKKIRELEGKLDRYRQALERVKDEGFSRNLPVFERIAVEALDMTEEDSDA